jgi:hypothetical protein
LKPGKESVVNERTILAVRGDNDYTLRYTLAPSSLLTRDVRSPDENYAWSDAAPPGGKDRENDVYGFEDDMHDGPNLKLLPSGVSPGHRRYSALGRR